MRAGLVVLGTAIVAWSAYHLGGDLLFWALVKWLGILG